MPEHALVPHEFAGLPEDAREAIAQTAAVLSEQAIEAILTWWSQYRPRGASRTPPHLDVIQRNALDIALLDYAEGRRSLPALPPISDRGLS